MNHWQFASLLRDLESDYDELPYCTQIRWLTCHKVLRSSFDLGNEINLFSHMKEKDVSAIKSTKVQTPLTAYDDQRTNIIYYIENRQASIFSKMGHRTKKALNTKHTSR